MTEPTRHLRAVPSESGASAPATPRTADPTAADPGPDTGAGLDTAPSPDSGSGSGAVPGAPTRSTPAPPSAPPGGVRAHRPIPVRFEKDLPPPLHPPVPTTASVPCSGRAAPAPDRFEAPTDPTARPVVPTAAIPSPGSGPGARIDSEPGPQPGPGPEPGPEYTSDGRSWGSAPPQRPLPPPARGSTRLSRRASERPSDPLAVTLTVPLPHGPVPPQPVQPPAPPATAPHLTAPRPSAPLPSGPTVPPTPSGIAAAASAAATAAAASPRPLPPTGDLLDGVGRWGMMETVFGGFQLRPVRLARELGLIVRWMNDPVVAAAWELSGPSESTEQHLLAQLHGDGRSVPCLGLLDGSPIGYFEVYRADLDPLARHYPSLPHDTGLHLLLGPPEARGRGLGSAVLHALAERALRERRQSRRIVAEPDLGNLPSRRAFEKAGFRLDRELALPGKHAALMIYDR